MPPGSARTTTSGCRRRLASAAAYSSRAAVAVELLLRRATDRRRVLELGTLGLEQRRQLLRRGGKRRREADQQIPIRAGPAHRPGPAQELQADLFLHPLRPAEQDRADLTGGADVGPAAGAAIQIANRDDPQRPLAARSPSGAPSTLAASSNVTSTARFSTATALAAAPPRLDLFRR